MNTLLANGKLVHILVLLNVLITLKGVRAVSLANSKNSMMTVVPSCHRAIAKSGDLTGYADDIDRKAWLLKHESVLLA